MRYFLLKNIHKNILMSSNWQSRNKPYSRPGTNLGTFAQNKFGNHSLNQQRGTNWKASNPFKQQRYGIYNANQGVRLNASSSHFRANNPFQGRNAFGNSTSFSQQAAGGFNRSEGQTPAKQGIGMSLLMKMGWIPGEGLGKNKEGNVEPLLLDAKMDKRGLVSKGEGPQILVTPSLESLGGKHPVSALQELCLKRRWLSPKFTVVNECGPSHKKCYLFRVRVNDVDYQPPRIIANKKQAKALAATVCLQALGVVPKDSDNTVQTA